MRTYITFVTNSQHILVDTDVVVEEVRLVGHVCKDAPNSSCQVDDRVGLELLENCSCCGQVSDYDSALHIHLNSMT